MRVLVIGSGGREHAIVWKISQSPLVKEILCAPGSDAISEIAKSISIPIQDIQGLVQLAKKNAVDLTIVGPELPLTLGVVDEFQRNQLRIFGPSREAAQLEASKIYAKKMMKRCGIPTSDFESFSNYDQASQYLVQHPYPLVIKADGLASGKGVLVAKNQNEAADFLKKVMVDKIFGSSGNEVLIEDCLEGQELSVLALMDAKSVKILPEARDHKRVFDHNQGPNTGGMGAFSPVAGVTEVLIDEINRNVFLPLLAALAQDRIDYRGVLYAGLMLTKSGPQVLEFNVRFGDPETQAILPRLESDLLELMLACCDQKLNEKTIEFKKNAAVSVVLSSGGYPDSYELGFNIEGLSQVSEMKDIVVFHAGTKKQNGHFITQGGRVLALTACSSSMNEARKEAYRAIDRINFNRMHFRRDIGLS